MVFKELLENVTGWLKALINLGLAVIMTFVLIDILFPGTTGVADALAYGVKVTGVTVHIVDEGLDTGPIILQEAVPVLPGDTEETLHQRIHEVEYRLYPQAISYFCEGRLRVEGRCTVILDEEEV